MKLIERTRLCLDAIAQRNPVLHAMISVNPAALEDAAAIEQAGRRGNLPGAGLIVSLKDNIDTRGLRTTMGSAFFADNVPSRDAPVVSRLRQAGALIIGKANLHEFAFGGTTQNPHHGLARNGWHDEAVPGGSSGGSGSSVAAGMCDVSLGTDTGGSIRIPAALNGVAGLRPTHGAVPNTGCFPVSDAFDTIGPLARTVAEVARVYEIIAGYDAGDSCSGAEPIRSWSQAFAQGVRHLRIGVPRDWCLGDDTDPEVASRLVDALHTLRELGADVRHISLREAPFAQQHLMPVLAADAAAVHAARLVETPEVFGPDVLDRLLIGKNTSSETYVGALRFRERWLRELDATFRDLDVIITPTVPITAPLARDAAQMLATTRALSRFTSAWAMAGVPALSVPIGFAANGLPVGMQLVAPRWRDATVLALGAHYQQATDHHLRRPAGFPSALG
ncbi:amidase [Chitinasiproducens palmae]|uniref:Aspartyl-tRNA(Asn)/glutamyl-tRNA(Gln) amidotransferase subunit A n=1 Tax=Chitinasiproducens palmae TaxID=1770053 RepID=A0A1H2PW99_9BURK|nr:amidase [Chitinasiproducens palmae]SDV50794.1 aspartyl-tRNA(Asn)/glutamyl-tRNA(Gln) amidotransferase subunit A [Chitinasiproducens palmae]